MPSNLVTAILHIERAMTGKRIAIGLSGAALAVAVALLLLQARKPPQTEPSAVSRQPSAPKVTPDRSVPTPIQPAKPTPGKISPEQALPPGTTVAKPGGDPELPIQPAPRGQRTIRDHRGLNEPPPQLKV